MKIARHENRSVRMPPSAAPISIPLDDAAVSFAISGWRRA
jgi:hypothetical protein